VLAAQARDRYPVYAEADLTVETGDTPHLVAVDAILKALAERAEAHS
jgi:shikimate kinase